MTGRDGTVVITGGSGFIGRALARRLLQDGHRVRTIDRNPAPVEGCEHVVADLACDDVSGQLDARAVFHLAGRPGVTGDDPDTEQQRLRDNVLATERVTADTPLHVPVVFASSSSVYGGSRGRQCREDDPLSPRGGYAWSKIAAEQLCRARARAGGRVQICRLFTVLGEGQRRDMALATWVAAVATGRPVQVYGDMQRSRDFTDVEDVVDALLAVASMDSSQVVNVGTGTGQSVAALLEAISAHLDRRPDVRFVAAPPQDPTASLADASRLQAIMGRRLQTDLMDVVGRYVRALGEDPRAAQPHAATV